MVEMVETKVLQEYLTEYTKEKFILNVNDKFCWENHFSCDILDNCTIRLYKYKIDLKGKLAGDVNLFCWVLYHAMFNIRL